jgi:hypothetical protein
MPMMVLFRSDPCQQDERGVVLHLQREEDDLPRGPLVPVPLFNEELIVLLVTSSRKCWARQFFQPASSSNKSDILIKVLAISDNSDFSFFFGGG